MPDHPRRAEVPSDLRPLPSAQRFSSTNVLGTGKSLKLLLEWIDFTSGPVFAVQRRRCLHMKKHLPISPLGFTVLLLALMPVCCGVAAAKAGERSLKQDSKLLKALTGKVTSIDVIGKGPGPALISFSVENPNVTAGNQAFVVTQVYEPQLFAAYVSILSAAHCSGCEVTVGYFEDEPYVVASITMAPKREKKLPDFERLLDYL